MTKLSAYPEYAHTSVAWLNEIPAHWKVKPIWSLFYRIKRTGFEGERLLSVYRDYGVIPKDSRDDNHNRASEDLSDYQLVEPGDLAINKMKAWQGSVGISSYRGIVSPAYFIFKAEHNENSRYLHYLMRCNRYIAGYQSISKGIRVNQWDLDPDKHTRMPVVLPPSDEQQAIVNFLDRETARIDTLIDKKARFIELLKEKRQAVITKSVTKGLDESVEMKDSGVEWIGKTPSHWAIVPMKYLILGSLQYGATESGDSFSADWPRYIRITDIASDGSLREDGAKSLDPSLAKPYLLAKGDILLARSGATVGKSFIYEGDDLKACFAGYMIKASANKEKILPKYLYLFLQSHSYWGYIIGAQSQATIQNVSAEKYGSLYVAVPPIPEQEEIASCLMRETKRLDELVSKTERSIELLKEHRSALITAAVTGKIDVREAA